MRDGYLVRHLYWYSALPSPTQNWGAEREEAAEAALVRAGYVILERNYRGAGAEIDRIAWDGDLLCFVEVRARVTDAFGTPAETVSRKKQAMIIRGARSYLMAFAPGAMPMVRFDVVSILDRPTGPRELTLYKNAFGVPDEVR